MIAVAWFLLFVSALGWWVLLTTEPEERTLRMYALPFVFAFGAAMVAEMALR